MTRPSEKSPGSSQEPPKPDCSKWNVWLGKEIEGTTDLGVMTVFIRAVPPGLEDSVDFSRGGTYRRVWFCKEFTDWKRLRAIAAKFETVCVEVDVHRFSALPQTIRAEYSIYLKVNLGVGLNLKVGDTICVGPAFADEAFVIGTGAKVTPGQYSEDTKLL